jgi:uncharacterized membrane protein
MNTKKLVAGSALAIAMAATVALPAHASDKEKCYGVAAAGQNDCANLSGSHSCAGQSTADNSMEEWKLVAKGRCVEMGGLLKTEAMKKHEASKTAQ